MVLDEVGDDAFERGRRAGLKDAARWCGRQASALKRLGREDEKRKAFVEAHNTILAMAEGRV